MLSEMIHKFLQAKEKTSKHYQSLNTFVEVSIIFIVLVAHFLGLLEPLEFLYYDLMLRLRQIEHQDKRIVLIEIDESDYYSMNYSSKISTKQLVNLIDEIQKHHPMAIGINILSDLINDNDLASSGLIQKVNDQENIFLAEKIIPPFIEPLSKVNPSKVGFADILPDQDSRIRRSILGLTSFQNEQNFRLSLSVLLAKHYLESKGHSLKNGINDPHTMRFGRIEIPRVYPNIGGYREIDNGGVQVMVNYRNSKTPFKEANLREFKKGYLKAEDIENSIVILGVVDPRKRFDLKTPLDPSMSGLELTAHFTSQLISAVLDDRPLIKSLGKPFEYIAILCFGIFIATPTWRIKPKLWILFSLEFFIALATTITAFLWFGYFGYWITVSPLILLLFLNFFSYFIFSLQNNLLKAKAKEERKANDKILAARLEERKAVVGRASEILHNIALQRIAIILSKLRNNKGKFIIIENDLEELANEIRGISDFLKQEELMYGRSLYLKNKEFLDLSDDLHNLFHQVYTKTLELDFPVFKCLKLKVRSFDEIPSESIDFEKKRQICRFLEEALLNVGKHSINASSIVVEGKLADDMYTLTVKDNGQIKSQITRQGEGTQQALSLEKMLNGEFVRTHTQDSGTICQLSWKIE